MSSTTPGIRVNALRIEQRADVPVYVFGVDGRIVHQLTTISYAERSKDGALAGYQRGAVTKHIAEIRRYLEGDKRLLPNAIVIAFDHRVKFTPLPGMQKSEWGTFGHLEIPLPRNAADTKAGWIVDGQQRVTALAQLAPAKSIPVVVVGFQSPSQELQREQFLLVNKTKPLPRDLLHEILPEVTTALPRDLEQRRLASKVLQKVRFDPASPFYGRVHGLGSEDAGSNISQAALLAVINNSIKKRGVLFDHFDGTNGKHNHQNMAKGLNLFFEGVRRTWPEAWNGNPKTSRLVHGVGIVSLGHLMDRIMREIDWQSQKAVATIGARLARIKDRCAWNSGRWPVIHRAWNELQNTSQDKALLTDYLLKEYNRCSS